MNNLKLERMVDGRSDTGVPPRSERESNTVQQRIALDHDFVNS